MIAMQVKMKFPILNDYRLSLLYNSVANNTENIKALFSTLFEEEISCHL